MFLSSPASASSSSLSSTSYLGGPSDQPLQQPQQQHPLGARSLSSGGPPVHQSVPPQQSHLFGQQQPQQQQLEQQQQQQPRPGLQGLPGSQLSLPPHLQHLAPSAPQDLVAHQAQLLYQQASRTNSTDQGGYSPNGQQQSSEQGGGLRQPGSSDGRDPNFGVVGISAAMDPLENVLGPFPCVRVRGIPYDVNLEDMMAFFQGLVILDVVVLNPTSHPKAQGKGEAFVLFSNPMDFHMALQRDKTVLMGNTIEVFHGKRNDYYGAIAAVSLSLSALLHWSLIYHDMALPSPRLRRNVPSLPGA